MFDVQIVGFGRMVGGTNTLGKAILEAQSQGLVAVVRCLSCTPLVVYPDGLVFRGETLVGSYGFS